MVGKVATATLVTVLVVYSTGTTVGTSVGISASRDSRLGRLIGVSPTGLVNGILMLVLITDIYLGLEGLTGLVAASLVFSLVLGLEISDKGGNGSLSIGFGYNTINLRFSFSGNHLVLFLVAYAYLGLEYLALIDKHLKPLSI